MDPQQEAVAREFDSYRDSYADAVNRSIGFSPLKVEFFVRAKAELIKQIAGRHFGEEARPSVLDVGCGVGQYQPLIAGRFGRIAGVDVSAGAIERARESNPFAEYVAYDGARLPFADGSFDVAFAVCVLHHVPVPQWTGFVGEMRRIVRKGGLAMIFEHNPRHPLTMKAVNNCPFDRDAVLVPPAKARELLKEAGFAAPRLRHILSIPPVGGVGRLADEALGVLRFGTQYCAFAEG